MISLVWPHVQPWFGLVAPRSTARLRRLCIFGCAKVSVRLAEDTAAVLVGITRQVAIEILVPLQT